MSYVNPSDFAKKMIDAGEAKVFMSTRDTLIRAYMAGAILALAAAFAVTVTVKTAGDSGKLFGSVTAADVAGAIKTAGGPTVDKRSVELPKGHIKATGSYPVVVNLHPQVSATVQLAVVQAVEEALSAGRSIPRDLTVVLYDAEEIASEHNGLGHLVASDPDLLAGDLAVLLEPTGGTIEGGCKGTLRVELTLTGTAAHSGRPWKGHNAIHDAADVLALLSQHLARVVEVDGLTYHEGLQAVGIRGGIAGNVIPDECVVTINYRFAPDRSEAEAFAFVQDFFDGFDLECDDLAGGARPGLDRPAAKAFVEALDLPVVAKEGWTDVARFSAVGVPAVNFGPGDPNVAHMDDEWCPEDQIVTALELLKGWLA